MKSATNPSSSKRSRSDQDEKREAAKSKREEVTAKYAAQMFELAEKALEAVKEMKALEEAAREEANYPYGVFSSDEGYTLEDAENAICQARYSANEAMKEKK
jgi:hypothetical protein